MDAIAANVLQGLTSLALEEFKLLSNAKDDVEKMRNTVGAIRATLLDAEAKANNNHNHQVSLWLARLRDVLYDADDLFDDLSTEALKRGIMNQNKVAKKVRIFFSKSNQLVYNLKMVHKLREVRGRLDDIDDERKKFQLVDHPLKPLSALEERKQTYSFVQEDEIIGREEEKNLVLHYLLDSNVKSCVSIIPIVGFGGLGKTALAQLVYNHVDVQKHFGLKRWVCVSDEFDVRQIAQKILGQAISTIEMEQVQHDFRQLIKGKKFFIVLDDVWNDDIELWHKLKSLLTKGAEGSMIIVTTRSEKVGKMMGTCEPIILKGLDAVRSWELFCRMAFEGGKESNDKELLAVGREIVQKCGGVPLAIRVAGGLVYDKTLEGIDLSYLRDCELWNIDQLEERIFAVLKLSYDHLPPPMKNCVAYCSLFPKDFKFYKQTLIQKWVAEGFIQSSNNKMRCEEDVGNEYFMNLLSRSFFQDVIKDSYGDIMVCKMHDLIHDLTQFVAKHEHLVIKNGKEECTRDTTRHLSYDMPSRFCEVPTSFCKFEKLRTMLHPTHTLCRMDHFVFDLVASKLKCLRVLGLRRSGISKIPENIGELKHLRFLDLSYNSIKQVPRAITRLHNLQTLNLSSNDALWELPRGIIKMVSLRHLHLTACWELEWMPSGLGQLTRLQTLTHFVIDDQKMQGRRKSAKISELGELNNLRGRLKLRGLKHLRSNPEEAESARLKEKQHIQELSLLWDTFEHEDDELYDRVAYDEVILEKLCPHHTIKGLYIKRFCGESLPEWIGDLLELQHVFLYGCKYLRSLPEGLSNLTLLRTLTIEGSPLLGGDEWPKIAHIPTINEDFLMSSGMLSDYMKAMQSPSTDCSHILI